ncbi:MAG: transcription termination/antitermination protein NusA [Sandaracinaceae bacterium]|nr:transcription termination/antitermination protein NusA [Sandaracinaceae bacterium]
MSQGNMSLSSVIDLVSQEKGIDRSVLVEATEQAILTAAKRTFGPDRELEARYNEESGAVDLFQYMTVVEEVDDPELEISTEDAERHGLEAEVGEELGFQIFYLAGDMERAREQDRLFGHLLGISQQRQGFGRIAAQTAKQVIIQRVRDAERERVFNDYKNRIGEIVTGVVRRFERGSNIIVDFGNGVEAVLPSREQTPRESYRPGDRVEALLKSIDREARGPQIILSRTDVGLLVKLFEREVPEICEGIVRVVAAAREPGARSKIAVSSRDTDVDPVGACVGMKGSRVQAVVQELRGEKIDIVPFDRDPARFVCNAIAPAEVVRVVIDETGQSMELVVPDSKLSLAIGRRGQNVRLASQLTKWRLDIVSEVRFKQMEEEAIEVLGRVGDANLGRTLYRLGFRTLDEVAEASLEELAGIEGVTDAEELRRLAEVEVETMRKERMVELAKGDEVPNDKLKLLLVPGVSQRIVDALDAGGYGSLQAILRETDVDRFALQAGLDAAYAKELKQGVEEFVKGPWAQLEATIKANRAKSRKAAADKAAVAAAEKAASAAPATPDSADDDDDEVQDA